MYLLKLAARPWRLAPLSQIFSGIAVGFLLLIIGFLFWMQQGLKTVVVRLQGEQVVTAYLGSSTDKKNDEKMVDTIRVSLGSQATHEVKLVTAPQFIDQLKGQYPELGKELENLGDEMYQVVPRYISISGMLPDNTVERVKRIPGIENVESSKDRYHHIVGAFVTLRWVVRVLMGGMCLALLTGLIHLSRMNAYLHRDALALLKYWGAGKTALNAPGMISGFFVGLLGGVIAWAGWISVGVWSTVHVRSLSTMLKGMPAAHGGLAFVLLFIGGCVGLIAGMLGNFSSPQLNQDGGLGT